MMEENVNYVGHSTAAVGQIRREIGSWHMMNLGWEQGILSILYAPDPSDMKHFNNVHPWTLRHDESFNFSVVCGEEIDTVKTDMLSKLRLFWQIFFNLSRLSMHYLKYNIYYNQQIYIL